MSRRLPRLALIAGLLTVVSANAQPKKEHNEPGHDWWQAKVHIGLWISNSTFKTSGAVGQWSTVFLL